MFFTLQVIFNSVRVYSGLSIDDITIFINDAKVAVAIQSIDAYISLSNTVFEIKLSPTLFTNNTEGQCGMLHYMIVITILVECSMANCEIE